MTPTLDLPPAQSFCAWHEDKPATWVCPRCGAFVCIDCVRRVRKDALPMCPGCWQRRADHIAAFAGSGGSGGTGLQTASVVFGVVALLPILPIQLLALGVAVVALMKTRRPEKAHARTRAMVGLGLTLAGLAIDVVLFGRLLAPILSGH